MERNKLIKTLRKCAKASADVCGDCDYYNREPWCHAALVSDAADALEADEQRIAEQQKQIALLYVLLNNRINEIAELEAQLPKEGKWIRKEVKVYCPRDCWNPSACAIEGTWNEEEGWNLEMKDGFCSVCGEQDEKYYGHHYCPNCGARMKTVTDCHTFDER